MKELLEEYEKSLKVREVRSYQSYLVTVKEFLLFVIEEQQDPLYLPLEYGDEYRSYLLHKEPPLSRNTINNKLNKVKNFYHHLLKRGRILFDPFEDTKGLKGGVCLPKNILSVDDVGILLSEFAIRTETDWLYLVLSELLYGSALRISEVVSLKLSDIDYSTRMLDIWDYKNQKARNVPASEVALRRLKYYCTHFRTNILTEKDIADGYLFPQKGFTTHRGHLNRKLKDECRRLGLPLITSHSFRHCAATHMLKKGAGIREVQAFLGHRKISSTQIYTRIITEDLKELVTTYHPREAAFCKVTI